MNRDLSAESKNTVGRKMKRNSVALTHWSGFVWLDEFWEERRENEDEVSETYR